MTFTKLIKFADSQGINLSRKQLDQFNCFSSFLLEKNKVMNLTAIKEIDEIETKHFIDSLEGYSAIKELAGNNFSLCDVGCGAGFPGIPLKIVFPEAHFVLLDSLNKRIDFVNEAIKMLDLTSAEGISGRAEDIAKCDLRESFDIVTSRAVARLNVLLEYCLPLTKIGGHCILYKSGSFQDELEESSNALKILGGEFARSIVFSLPENDGDRSLVIIKKISSTPEKYPRRAGKPSKSPL